MKKYEGVDVEHHVFLTSALVGVSLSDRLTSGGRVRGPRFVGGWVGPRVGLNDLEKRKFLTLEGLELRILGRPARNQSLYRLHYLAENK
jgi:hypothetical protein